MLPYQFLTTKLCYLLGCVWNIMAHAQKPDFVLMRLKCDGTCAETRFRLNAFEMWWQMRRNQISSYCFRNVMADAQKPDFVLLRFKCDGKRAENRFSFWAKRTSPFKSAGWTSVQSTTGSRVVRISRSNAGYTTFRGNVKSTGYPLHSPVPLTSPPVLHRASSHFNWTLHTVTL